MHNENTGRLIEVAAGRQNADLVIGGAKIVDVCNGTIIQGDLAIADGMIAGIGEYEGNTYYDAQGAFLLPGFIDGHVHIESSLVDPFAFCRLVVPHGTTTVIADPHEICNVCGLDGLDYMLKATESLPLSVFFMLPSCVPATPFEHAGASLDAAQLATRIDQRRVLGLGELMNMEATIHADSRILDKLAVAKKAGKLVDGHAPFLTGKALNAYVASGVHTDHECSSAQELAERIQNGMYVLLREGSACHDLRNLLAGVTKENELFCLFCTDDRQPHSIIHEGHIDHHLRIAIEEGVNPISAIRMATLYGAQCYRLFDRGAIAVGKRADLVLVEDLASFRVRRVWAKGIPVASEGTYLGQDERISCDAVRSRVNIGPFLEKDLALQLSSNRVRVIKIKGNSIITETEIAYIRRDEQGYYCNDPHQDIVKLAVVERHRGSGRVALALLGGYGLMHGAVATTIAHDSHNIIAAGDNDADMAFAIQTLADRGGGIVLVREKRVLGCLELPIAGLMSNKDGGYVDRELERMYRIAREELGIHEGVDALMTLSFMALPVIPHLKVTDMGLFDVDAGVFVPLEA